MQALQAAAPPRRRAMGQRNSKHVCLAARHAGPAGARHVHAGPRARDMSRTLTSNAKDGTRCKEKRRREEEEAVVVVVEEEEEKTRQSSRRRRHEHTHTQSGTDKQKVKK